MVLTHLNLKKLVDPPSDIYPYGRSITYRRSWRAAMGDWGFHRLGFFSKLRFRSRHSRSCTNRLDFPCPLKRFPMMNCIDCHTIITSHHSGQCSFFGLDLHAFSSKLPQKNIKTHHFRAKCGSFGSFTVVPRCPWWIGSPYPDLVRESRPTQCGCSGARPGRWQLVTSAPFRPFTRNFRTSGRWARYINSHPVVTKDRRVDVDTCAAAW